MRLDGGMAKNNWLCQFIADIIQAPVIRPHTVETTALGVAYMAGLSAGVVKYLTDIQEHWHAERHFSPKIILEDRNKLYKGWRDAIQRTI